MTGSDAVYRWLEAYRRICAENVRDSQAIPFAMLEQYDALNHEEKGKVHELLGRWLVSDDAGARYDAVFLIGERHIHGLRSQVEDAIAKWESAAGPIAFYEAKSLRRLWQGLWGGDTATV